MINKYFFVVHNTDESICGIKRYRGLVDLEDHMCFSSSSNHRCVRVDGEEWFKIAEIDKYVDPDVYHDLDISGKCVAKWNFIKKRVVFNPVVVVRKDESDVVENNDSSFLTTTTKNNINYIDGGKTHRLVVSLRSMDRLYGADDTPLRRAVKYRVLVDNKHGTTNDEKTLIIKKNTEHEIVFEKPNIPCKIRLVFFTDSPDTLISSPFFLLEYK